MSDAMTPPEVLRATILQLVAAPSLLAIRDADQGPDEPGGLIAGYALLEFELEKGEHRWTGRDIFPFGVDGYLETGGYFGVIDEAHGFGDWRPTLVVGVPLERDLYPTGPA